MHYTSLYQCLVKHGKNLKSFIFLKDRVVPKIKGNRYLSFFVYGLAAGLVAFALSIFLKEYGYVDNITYAMTLFRSFWHPIALLPYCYEEKKERLKQWAILALERSLQKIQGQ